MPVPEAISTGIMSSQKSAPVAYTAIAYSEWLLCPVRARQAAEGRPGVGGREQGRGGCRPSSMWEPLPSLVPLNPC